MGFGRLEAGGGFKIGLGIRPWCAEQADRDGGMVDVKTPRLCAGRLPCKLKDGLAQVLACFRAGFESLRKAWAAATTPRDPQAVLAQLAKRIRKSFINVAAGLQILISHLEHAAQRTHLPRYVEVTDREGARALV